MVTLVAGGDVEWSRLISRTPILFDRHRPDGDRWPPTPKVRARLAKHQLLLMRDKSDIHASDSMVFNLLDDDQFSMQSYPFSKIAHIFSRADIGFINLEMPLTTYERRVGDFKGSPAFACALSAAGVNLVSLANNHMLDAEGPGLMETISCLRRANIATIGAGVDLLSSTRPVVKVLSNSVFAFLAYSQIPCEASGASFATKYRSGIAPLDPSLVQDDVRVARKDADFVIVSFHWGIEGSCTAHPRAREIGRLALRAGAHLILGHHPHVPQGIELFDGGFIVYSMGNLIFGHNHSYWGDNILVEVTFSTKRIERLRVLPVAGVGRSLARPYPLFGKRARRLLASVAEDSRRFGTKLRVDGDVGFIFPTR